MDSTSWIDGLSTSKQYQSRNDSYLDYEDTDSDEDYERMEEYPCPFCFEEFDVIGLCCHIDEEHTVDAEKGLCPICGIRVGRELVGHMTTQHEKVFRIMQRKRKLHKDGYRIPLPLLKKELKEVNLHSLLGDSYGLESSSNSEPDPLLSSFIYSSPITKEPTTLESYSSAASDPMAGTKHEHVVERNSQLSPLSHKDQEEKASRSEFVQGLLLSTIFDDIL